MYDDQEQFRKSFNKIFSNDTKNLRRLPDLSDHLISLYSYTKFKIDEITYKVFKKSIEFKQSDVEFRIYFFDQKFEIEIYFEPYMSTCYFLNYQGKVLNIKTIIKYKGESQLVKDDQTVIQSDALVELYQSLYPLFDYLEKYIKENPRANEKDILNERDILCKNLLDKALGKHITCLNTIEKITPYLVSPDPNERRIAKKHIENLKLKTI